MDKPNQRRTVTDQIEEVIDKIAKVLKKHGVKREGLFGSLVRGEMNEEVAMGWLMTDQCRYPTPSQYLRRSSHMV